MYNNYYPNDTSNIIRSSRYPNDTSNIIRSSRYPNTNNPNNYPNNYPNIYPNTNTTSIRSPRYINRNTYSNLPENWSEHISHSGLPYYYNSITGESQFQHPTINTHLPHLPQLSPPIGQRMRDIQGMDQGMQDLQNQVRRSLGL